MLKHGLLPVAMQQQIDMGKTKKETEVRDGPGQVAI